MAVDGELNNEIEDALKPYNDKITVFYNRERLGKSNSLNKAVSKISSDVLLFLDNDVLLNDDPEFLQKLSADMEKNDIAEIPKEAISGSLLSRMMAYEFLGFAMTTYTLAKLSHRCPSMNGAAFAVRKDLFDKLSGFRNVVNEDTDFAARSYKSHARFSYNPALKIKNEVPSNLRDWLIQRKRWALNNVLWLRDNFFMVITHFFKSPSLFLSSVLLLLPLISYIIAFLILRYAHMTVVLPFVFMIVQHGHIIAGIFLLITHYNLIFSEGLIPTAIGLLVSGIIYFGFARILRFRFNPLEFILYYFIYSPVWLLGKPCNVGSGHPQNRHQTGLESIGSIVPLTEFPKSLTSLMILYY